MSNQILIESNFETKILVEETHGQKNWFLEGIFMQADVVNRNRRIYPLDTMSKQINEYTEQFVKTKRAVGELQHPNTPEINLDRVSHIIENIRQDSKNFIGKARILNTPAGNIARGLLEGGVQLGVSSRGMGEVQEKNGVSIVQPNFRLATVDIVYSPSAPEAFVNGLMEGSSWLWNSLEEDTPFLETLKQQIKKTPSRDLEEASLRALQLALTKVSK